MRTGWGLQQRGTYGGDVYRHSQHVLIDARTGLTDVSGICTMLLPGYPRGVRAWRPRRGKVQDEA